MKGHGEQKSKKMELAVISLITCKRMKEAAQKSGVSETTLWRWQQQEDFKKMLQDCKSTMVERGLSRLQNHIFDAVEVLAEIMKATGAPEAARVTAARALIDFGVQECRVNEVLRRVEKLELLNEELINNCSRGGFGA
ncbi:MAG: hypothetical protein GX279_09970 [Clostridiaceae bacterium]|nr:hypothetical protein [Clostridiaceae bacterium]